MRTGEMIAVMQAYENGEEIEFRKLIDEYWQDCFMPKWSWDTHVYRIKLKTEDQNFKAGDKVILKCKCNGEVLTKHDICKVTGVDKDSLHLDISHLPFCPDGFIKVDDVLWYWEYNTKNHPGIWERSACRHTKEGAKMLFPNAINLAPFYALGARIEETKK